MTDELAALRARVAELEAMLPAPDPECPYCAGTGERFWHSEDCRSDDCALAGGIDDCNGVVEPCPCAPPTPDPRDARIAYLENLVAGFEAGGRVSFGRCSPEVQHRLARIAELEAALREADARIRWHVKYQGTSDEDEAALAASIRALGDDDEPIELTLAEIDRRDRIIAEAAAVAARAQIVGWLRWQEREWRNTSANLGSSVAGDVAAHYAQALHNAIESIESDVVERWAAEREGEGR